MINLVLQALIRERIREIRSYDPKWSEDDVFHSACGAALKYAEEHGQKSTPELRVIVSPRIEIASFSS